MSAACTEGWQALRGDPLPALLEDDRPGVRARILTDLMGRPGASPAVRRAHSGANAGPPIAALLEDLWPDGTWRGRWPRWSSPDGEGWRLVEAVAWGADPHDPRLSAGWKAALENLEQDGGWRPRSRNGGPSAAFTARLLEAAVPVLGWKSELRLAEAAAWLEEAVWDRPEITAVAVLGALRAGSQKRPKLAERAVARLGSWLAEERRECALGFPNRLRVDSAEVLSALAWSGGEYRPEYRRSLAWLQHRQDGGGRWDARRPRSGAQDGSVMVTARAVGALLAFAVPAKLPRLFPAKPG